MKAEFEEKTFEVAANLEFGLLGAGASCPGCGLRHCLHCGVVYPAPTMDIWAPGQVLEGLLGFDVMVELGGDTTEVAALVGTAIPAGMHWKQHYGYPAGGGSAPDWASLFIQYKRPDWLERRRGRFRTLFPGPFFRFELDAQQHEALSKLSMAAAGDALVLYAAPRFHTNDDMSFYRKNHLVLERTAFIELDDDPDHLHGAYDETKAFLCSEPQAVSSYGLAAMLSVIRRLDAPASDSAAEGLSAHLARIARAAREAERGNVGSRDDDQELQTQIRTILTFAARNSAVWLLCASSR